MATIRQPFLINILYTYRCASSTDGSLLTGGTVTEPPPYETKLHVFIN